MESAATRVRASRDLTTAGRSDGHGHVLGASVSEIHRYPLVPAGVEEPLWMTREWRRAILDHLCESSWLSRASEIPVRTSTQSAHSLSEDIYLLKRGSGTSVIRCKRPLRTTATSLPLWRRKLIIEVVDLWREIRGWWLPSPDAINRLVVRVMLMGGIVVDLARYGSDGEDGWKLVGIVD